MSINRSADRVGRRLPLNERIIFTALAMSKLEQVNQCKEEDVSLSSGH